MGILSRFTDIMGANINSALSKAESKNADKLLEKYLQDAKNNLGQVKAETAAVIAEETALARKLQEAESLHRKYGGYAEAAVKSQNEDDARKFLAEQIALEPRVAELSKQYETAKQNSEKMRQMTEKLMGDIQSAQQKLEDAKRTLAVAKQQDNMNKLNEKFSDDGLGNFDNLLGEIQKRADKAEAMAELQSGGNETQELDDLMKKYDTNGSESADNSLESRLAQLKSGVNRVLS